MPLALKKQTCLQCRRRLTTNSQKAAVEPSPKLRISTDLDYEQSGAVVAAWVGAMSPLWLAHQSLGCEPVEAVLFEYQNDVGGTFLARAYEDAELVSSRQLTCFSDFRHASSKDFLAASEYVEYLRNYCSHFNLWPHIKLSTRVVSVSRGSRRNHVIEYQADGRSLQWGCDAVAICSGLHVEPNVPEISGISHARRGGDGGGLRRDRGGCGVSGGHPSRSRPSRPLPQGRVPFCTKGSSYSFIKRPYRGFGLTQVAAKRNPGPVLLPILGRVPNPAEPGIPIDVSRANLFDTAYVHRILCQQDDWLWEYYRLYITVLLWLSSETTAGMDHLLQQVDEVCPYISLPYRPQVPGRRLWLYALRSALVQTPVEDTNGRYVDLAPWPLQVQPSGFVEFVDYGRPEYQKMKERQARPDMMVLCTGYKQSFPFLDTQSNPPYATPDTANIRRIWERSDPSVGFIGFALHPSASAPPG
ncbi:Dimethylaniline monooxygenase [N-oxide-forming] 2 [Beauveria bassiana D1-5]|uniref:Dimethylaniline monooxygenase [N-oxide-forming] 2 n=1 Tax=Beauveria bassiana D1-5 TaxID=1245745 RepID=A0A0A2V7T6_BEABA|nr:Dimethylaniline monooxygenase [N-oxide-forming] 2 [Beauveria bassiana D1-5]